MFGNLWRKPQYIVYAAALGGGDREEIIAK